MAVSSSSGSDSDGSPSSNPTRHADFSTTIFQSYLDQSNDDDDRLSKLKSILTTSSSGALSCLICLERIRPADPTWSCSALCHSLFHLPCIQSWAHQSSSLQASRSASRNLPASLSPFSWSCPKCRSPYPATDVPRKYLCFCGKLQDPPGDDPWVLPHSCGEVCARPLRDRCGHHCILLCHPGPCPSCPKLVEARCFCSKRAEVRRCGAKEFSCRRECGRLKGCGAHRCGRECHEGECGPCGVRGVYACRCGREEGERECWEQEGFRCGNPCGRTLSCGRHECEKGCHWKGECGDCHFQGRRTCPCGKRVYDGMPCDVEAPVCGGTCGKVLGCGFHRCPERCHRGACIETCRIMVNKMCRCGGLKKEVPCYQDLSCERKCQRTRDCGRHACKRRCCDGNCPPCGEICGKRLRCTNHKCPAPCHPGACSPCPLTVKISCACGQTHFEVPCGAEKDQKPPRCRKMCQIRPLCRHGSNCKPHKCHYGPCPPCRLICEEVYPCGHQCQLSCHGQRPPTNPEFTLRPKKKKGNHQPECSPGSPCPPCPEILWKPCVGHHHGADRMMVCSNITEFSCDNLCGNPLSCGNHYCTKTCHALVNKSLMSLARHSRMEPCEECHLPCEKERDPPCQHSCPLTCHPGECPPCKVLVKRACHCGAMVHVFECIYYNNLSEKEQISVRSCGGPCHRKLPNCTHLCPETCHPGQCPSPDKCCKKITARCACQTLKKEWLCQDVQTAYRERGSDPKDVSKGHFGVGLIECNSDCNSKIQIAKPELHQRKSKDFEAKDPNAEKHHPKRRRRRERIQETEQISALQKIISKAKWILFFVIIAVTLMAVAYFGYNGLMRLSDWMNAIEDHRQRKRYPRT